MLIILMLLCMCCLVLGTQFRFLHVPNPVCCFARKSKRFGLHSGGESHETI